ncbi:MAG: serine hydrolase [bacterium]|nr:serine hydrolase [bacterium]
MTKNHTIHTYVEENEPNICEITVIKENAIIYQDYWHGYTGDDALNVMSVTKSIVALLTGIAIDLGCIAGVDEPVLSFFPDYTVKRGEKTIYDVTIRHLLTMTAPYKYRSEPWTKVCTSDDWTKAALDLLGGRKGITGEFRYATLGIQIMNGIIEQATGETVIDFANQHLFEPLGITSTVAHGDCSKEDQFDYLMNKKPRKHEWYCDPGGVVTAGWGLSLSATDLAKIGIMLAHDGCYQEKRIVSKEWIRQMTTPYQKLGEQFGNQSYGFLWWIPDEKKDAFAAIGDGGNVIYVNPKKHLAVGVAGTFKPRIFDRVEFIETKLLPAIDEA